MVIEKSPVVVSLPIRLMRREGGRVRQILDLAFWHFPAGSPVLTPESLQMREEESPRMAGFVP
ncbi:hypothetical protein [uncultured Aquabacterium sp.]|uniref:hypothetical protein n=1 Tax=Aquabacterium sp. TaxID=1872578 RepID=UPI0025F40ECD|nr:hypothetical protein [uncultured Aquabacterium sp.]